MQRLVWLPVMLGLVAGSSWADEPASNGTANTPPAAVQNEAPNATQGSGQAGAQGGAQSGTASAVQNVAPEDAEAVLGQRILDQNGKTIGRLIDVLVNAAGQPQAAVIDFGGFMGVGNRKVAVHWSVLHFNPADPDHKVVLDMTPDQIKGAPEYRSQDQAAPVVTPATPAASSP